MWQRGWSVDIYVYQKHELYSLSEIYIYGKMMLRGRKGNTLQNSFNNGMIQVFLAKVKGYAYFLLNDDDLHPILM